MVGNNAMGVVLLINNDPAGLRQEHEAYGVSARVRTEFCAAGV